MYNGVIRRIFPRTKHRFRTCHHTHVAGSRSGSSSFGRHHVIISVFIKQFGRFQVYILPLCNPVGRIFPTVVHLPALSGNFQSVITQRGNPTVVGKQVTLSIFSYHMTGVNAFYIQLYRFAPRTANIVGINHIVFARRCGIINVITILVFQQVGCPNRSFIFRQCSADRLPVQQISGMPDKQSGSITKRRMRHVIILPVAQDRRVRIITGKDCLGKLRPYSSPHRNKKHNQQK